MHVVDPALKDYGATARQKEYIDLSNELGSMRAAARQLGLTENTVQGVISDLRKRAARQGYAPGHFQHGTAPGYAMGKVTVQRGPGGSVERTWERQSPAREEQEAALRAYVEHLMGDAKSLAPITPPPAHVLDDLMAIYAFGDPHFGLRAIASEAGEDFGLGDADRLTRAGIDGLVSVTPAAGTALLLNIGDNLHANDSSNKTPGHGNPLDIDGRHSEAVLVAAKAWAYAVKRLLEKHASVIVWFLPGNHDPDAQFALALCLAMHFDAEPRVQIDVNASLYRYMRFGKNLLGAHHGHGAKPADLPLLMAVDRPEDWGATVFRYVWMGHIHHDTVKEIQGVRVESLRSLAAKDAWHAGKGYRSMRDTRSIVLHKDYGEIGRHVCSLAMLQEAAA